LTPGRRIAPTSTTCRRSRQHEFRRRWRGVAPVGLRPPCAPPRQRQTGRGSTYPELKPVQTNPAGAKLIVKEFPILSIESLIASKAALASVEQGKYKVFHQALLTHKGHLNIDQIDGIATEAGIDLTRLHKDEAAPEIADAIIYNFNLARSLKITGTPGFIVGGKVLSSPSTEDDFKRAVAEAREKL